MDIAEFEDRLDRYGADLADWPEPDRDAAGALLSASAEAAALLKEEMALRQALTSAPGEAAPAWLADRILTATAGDSGPGPGRSAEAGWRIVRFPALLAIVLPLCFAGGLAIGLYRVPADNGPMQPDFLALLSSAML